MSTNPETLRQDDDKELDRKLMSPDYNDQGREMVRAEINRRYLKKSIEENFVPLWVGWATFAAAILAALAAVLALFL